jgi:DNA primase
MSDSDFRVLVDRARDRHLLSDIVGRHTKLDKRGTRELVGLCCFHQERTPSLEVNDAKGTYHCHGCGAGGDALTFLKHAEGKTFREAVELLLGETFPVIPEEERAARKAQDERHTAARIELARSIWASTIAPEGTPAEVYACSRGITAPLPTNIRFAMTPRWRNDETGEVGRDHPAMVCALQDVDDQIVGVQCIFLADGGRRKYAATRPDGSKAKAKLTFGLIVGCALRLRDADDHITLCEGPEDGLTLMQLLPGRTIWVSCGTAMLPQVQLPSSVERLTLAGDNGAAGHKAVEKARARFLSEGLAVNDTFPDAAFKDWNDQLRRIRS